MWQIIDQPEAKYLVRGGEVHGGLHKTDPTKLSSKHIATMLLDHPTTGTVLHLGLGMGEIARWLHNKHPELHQVAVEIDGNLLNLASFFDLPSRLKIAQYDSAVWLRLSPPFDTVYLDTNQTITYEIHRQLCRVTKKLLVINFWKNPQVHAISRLAKRFTTQTYQPTPDNIVVIAHKK